MAKITKQMSDIIQLNTDLAIFHWNQFLSSVPVPSQVPFSFNPSLFDFYVRYFRWKPYYFIFFREDEPIGLCPLVNTGKSWVSLPHFSYGGFINKPDDYFEPDEITIQKLIFLVQKERLDKGFYKVDIDVFPSLEYFNENTFIRTIQPGFLKKSYQKVSSFLPLPQTGDELLKKLKSNLRRKIAKAKNSGFDIQIGGKELISSFYKVYSQKVHSLGSPAYGRSFFQNLIENYRFGESLIFLVTRQQKVVGAALLLSYGDFYESTWFATCQVAYKNYVSDFLHWQMILYALSKNAKIYSFGRSTINGSVHRYKSHWPVVDVPIYQTGDNSIKNQKWLSSVWKRMPYSVVRQLGPVLVKHIY